MTFDGRGPTRTDMSIARPHPHHQAPTCTDLRVTTSADARAALFLVECRLLEPVKRRPDDIEKSEITHGHTFIWVDGPKGETGLERWTDGRSWGASRCRDDFLIYEEKSGDKRLTKITYTARRNVFEDKGNLWHLIAYYYEEEADSLIDIRDHSRFGPVAAHMPKGYFVSNRKDKSRKVKEVPPMVYESPVSQYDDLLKDLASTTAGPTFSAISPTDSYANNSPNHWNVASNTRVDYTRVSSLPTPVSPTHPIRHGLHNASYSSDTRASLRSNFSPLPLTHHAPFVTVTHEDVLPPPPTSSPSYRHQDELAHPHSALPLAERERNYRRDQMARTSPQLNFRGRPERESFGPPSLYSMVDGGGGGHDGSGDGRFKLAPIVRRPRDARGAMMAHRRPGSPQSSTSSGRLSPPLSYDGGSTGESDSSPDYEHSGLPRLHHVHGGGSGSYATPPRSLSRSGGGVIAGGRGDGLAALGTSPGRRSELVAVPSAGMGVLAISAGLASDVVLNHGVVNDSGGGPVIAPRSEYDENYLRALNVSAGCYLNGRLKEHVMMH